MTMLRLVVAAWTVIGAGAVVLVVMSCGAIRRRWIERPELRESHRRWW